MKEDSSRPTTRLDWVPVHSNWPVYVAVAVPLIEHDDVAHWLDEVREYIEDSEPT